MMKSAMFTHVPVAGTWLKQGGAYRKMASGGDVMPVWPASARAQALRNNYLPQKGAMRSVYRSEYEAVVERQRARMRAGKAKMRERSCYNFTRVLNIIGFDKFRDYCVQRQRKQEKCGALAVVFCVFGTMIFPAKPVLAFSKGLGCQ